MLNKSTFCCLINSSCGVLFFFLNPFFLSLVKLCPFENGQVHHRGCTNIYWRLIDASFRTYFFFYHVPTGIIPMNTTRKRGFNPKKKSEWIGPDTTSTWSKFGRHRRSFSASWLPFKIFACVCEHLRDLKYFLTQNPLVGTKWSF